MEVSDYLKEWAKAHKYNTNTENCWKKEEALKLADYVDAREINNPHLKEVSAMIRRLVEELDKQGSSIWDSTRRVYENCQCDSCKNKTTPQTKPLSDDEIVSIWEKANYESQYYEASDNFAIEFARAIEERHGIK